MKPNNFLALVFAASLAPGMAQAQLTGMNPNTAYPGQQNFNTTITSSGLFVQSSSPTGNLFQIYLQQGAYTFDLFNYSLGGWNANVVDPNTVDVTNINIPLGAQSGTYDLHVTTGDWWDPWSNQMFYTLPAAFTVTPPDGAIQGNVYIDANNNGMKDAGELPAAGESILLSPSGLLLNTDAQGNFDFPVLNGTHTVAWQPFYLNYKQLTTDSASYTVTINNDTASGRDFGIIPSLSTFTPNFMAPGTTVNTTITAKGIFKLPPPQQGNISLIRLVRPGYVIQPTLVYIIAVDSNTATAQFNISPTAAIGWYKLEVHTSSPVRYHFLDSAVYIGPFPNSGSGNVYYDINQNGFKDGGDYGLPGMRVRQLPDSTYGFSNIGGNYTIGLMAGSHQFEFAPLPGSNFAVTSAPTLNFTVPPSATGLDFGVTSTSPDYSCTIQMNAGILRCNTSVAHIIYFTNWGNLPFNGYIKLVLDSNVTFQNCSPMPAQVNGDTVIWNFTSLPTGLTSSIYANVQMPGPGVLISNTAYIYALDGSSMVQNVQSATKSGTVVCSYDPNDKAVSPPGVQPPHFTLKTDSLEYLIRFQNTGNDTAFNVTIVDYLDPDLDRNTLEVLGSSHSVMTEVQNDGDVWFSFANILLPDSNVNEPGSHGFVSYRIRPKSGLADGTEINNTAYILFDVNAPVVTNTTWNTLVTTIPVGIPYAVPAAGPWSLFPNPVTDQAVLVFPNPGHDPYILTVFNVQGQAVIREGVRDERCLIPVRTLPGGLYFFRLDPVVGGTGFNGKFVVR